PSPPACGWPAPTTTSAGPTTACACSLPTTPLRSGSAALQPSRPTSPTTPGLSTSSSTFRSPYLAGSHPGDAAALPNVHRLEPLRDHSSVGCYPEVRQEQSGGALS